jgi:hypothetical protein
MERACPGVRSMNLRGSSVITVTVSSTVSKGWRGGRRLRCTRRSSCNTSWVRRGLLCFLPEIGSQRVHLRLLCGRRFFRLGDEKFTAQFGDLGLGFGQLLFA